MHVAVHSFESGALRIFLFHSNGHTACTSCKFIAAAAFVIKSYRICERMFTLTIGAVMVTPSCGGIIIIVTARS